MDLLFSFDVDSDQVKMSRLVRLLDPCGHTKEETWPMFSVGMSGLPGITQEAEPGQAEVKSVSLREDLDGDGVRSLLKEQFQIPDLNNLILRIRSHRGSLIPIGPRIPANSKSEPYILEVVKMYQHVKPSPRTVRMNTYNDTLRKKLDSVLKRIEKLELATTDLHGMRNRKIKAEMEDLDHKLSFLNKRFEQADSSAWIGMFKKNPLW